MNFKKRQLAVLLALVLMLASAVNCNAASAVPDLNAKGSIAVSMKRGRNVVSGGTLTIYKVANVASENGDFIFKLCGDFTNSGFELKDVQSAELASDMSDYALTYSGDGVTREIGKDGALSFENLDVGLYLILQTEAAEGYSKIKPFLISIPMYNGEEYIYDVDADPKISLETDTIEITDPSETTAPSDETEPTTNPGETTVPEGTTNPNETTVPGTTTVTTTGKATTKETTEPTTKEETLPKTGQLNWPVPVLVIAGLVIFSFGWVLTKKKED